jgi:hypothetical protein
MIKIEQKTFNCITYYDLERLIRDTFPILSKFEIISAMCWNNDSYYQIDFKTVANNIWLDEEDIEVVNDLVNNPLSEYSYVSPYTIFTALVEKGVLPEGQYLVEVSW